MITFKRGQLVKDLTPEAIKKLKENGIRPNIISPEDADAVSSINSKAMVLVQFIQNDRGEYQIKLQDKSLYNYTQKLVSEYFKMKIIDVDKPSRTITAVTDHLGVALDVIEILGYKYNLSIVQEN